MGSCQILRRNDQLDVYRDIGSSEFILVLSFRKVRCAAILFNRNPFQVQTNKIRFCYFAWRNPE